MEGAICAVPGVCASGGWFGGECGSSFLFFSFFAPAAEVEDRTESADWGWKQTVMVLKYLIKQYPLPTLYFGIANVVANGLVMLRYVDTFPASIYLSVC